ncbi:MAG: hypothetical protein Q8930_16685 [Bacillota bacterium]|nr:hypothetical protein [Bacillota bacterium]
MYKKVIIFFIFLFFSPLLNTSAYGCENIEIFDITKEEVVRTIPSSKKIQKEVKGYLYNITGIYAKFNPIPDRGFAIKVFLEPPVTVKSKLSYSTVEEVIVMFPEKDAPFLMVFEGNENLICYNFKGKTDRLLKKLKYPSIDK